MIFDLAARHPCDFVGAASASKIPAGLVYVLIREAGFPIEDTLIVSLPVWPEKSLEGGVLDDEEMNEQSIQDLARQLMKV